MSDTFTETIPRDEAVEPAPPRTRASVRWIRRIVLLVVLLWIVSEGISLAIQHTGLRNLLTARLQSAFGRPVEVGSYDFSVLDGLALEANSVTVGEDPRFGQEYFLRADSITVRLRWTSLLRGRVEFGTLALTKPSLNLVRNPDGDWNLTQWLPQPAPRPAPRVPVGPAFPSTPLSFRRVEVDGGRINFKNGNEKLPFAFVGVKGTVETDRPGRWRMNLEATPWRAAVVMQQAGTIHLSGDLGGTSSRLRPAALDVNWYDASLSDVLRLASGNDDGIRGAFALQISAGTADNGDGWTAKTRAQLEQIHRWNFAPRPDNPSLDLDAHLAWSPSAPYLEITQATLDAPHSHAKANGRLYWRHETQLVKQSIVPVQVVYTDADMDVRDLLAWATAFHGSTAENLAVRGYAHAHAAIAEWPPRIVDAEISSEGAELSEPSLRRPARLGEVRFRYDHGAVSLAPVALSFSAPDDAVHFESTPKPGRTVSNSMHISANVSDVHDVIAAASVLGWNLAKGWDVSGPVRADLRWQGAEYPWRTPPVGSINWGAGPGVAVLRVPFLNQPIGNINAVSEWKPGSRHVAIASADTFGAHWNGTFDRVDSAPAWQFSLAGDRLSAADLDRWINPAWRESFLARMLPFLNSRPTAAAAPENLGAAGHLVLEQFTLAPLVVRKLQGDLRIEGRHITFANATGQFYGGQVSGSLDADLLAVPAYHADLDFSRIDAAALAAATPALAGITAKSAGGQISITAAGANRASLIASFACQGNATANAFQFFNIALPKFVSADASFSCSQRKIEFQTLSLASGTNAPAVGSGTIDFGRNLDLRFRSASSAHGNEDVSDRSFRLAGTLAAPKLITTPATPRRSR